MGVYRYLSLIQEQDGLNHGFAADEQALP